MKHKLEPVEGLKGYRSHGPSTTDACRAQGRCRRKGARGQKWGAKERTSGQPPEASHWAPQHTESAPRPPALHDTFITNSIKKSTKPCGAIARRRNMQRINRPRHGSKAPFEPLQLDRGSTHVDGIIKFKNAAINPKMLQISNC